MTSVRIIHAGLGGWGGNWARIVIPTVPSVERRRHRRPGPRHPWRPRPRTSGSVAAACFASLEDALAAVEADAVVITSPVATHVPLALMALDAGKHVLVEKPLANTVEEARRAAVRAEELGLILQVSQNYRNYPAPRAVRGLAARRARSANWRRSTSTSASGTTMLRKRRTGTTPSRIR